MYKIRAVSLKDYRKTGAENTGILVIHGFTSSTTESVPIAKIFEEQGYSVSAPLLPGHGTTSKELDQTKWWQWTQKAEKEYEWLKKHNDKIIIGGSSMGGVISLYLASKLKIDGVFTLGTPYDLSLKVKILVTLLNTVKRSLKKPAKTIKYYEKTGLKSYYEYPPRAMKQLTILFKQMQKNLHKVSAPYSGHFGAKDDLMTPKDPLIIMSKIKSKKANTIWYKSSGHILITEPDWEKIKQNLLFFVKTINT